MYNRWRIRKVVQKREQKLFLKLRICSAAVQSTQKEKNTNDAENGRQGRNARRVTAKIKIIIMRHNNLSSYCDAGLFLLAGMSFHCREACFCCVLQRFLVKCTLSFENKGLNLC